ncbi:nitrogen regulation protein NR(II) [Methanosphaerula palustris]|uniref:PAS/PAC sensor protein n=1 Tax=Methanosphaerula palustris (strain ATCC BAA-1556 / DSM 19958 / E1-9c) TaxID=521011 RepID=B8GE10_METPE|nr:PAS domain-containing protein [Methanosphaerula palustris]ACL17511.1 hypothetical protein Mpal_2218 [Methanosphaerula palustris E1-9c]
MTAAGFSADVRFVIAALPQPAFLYTPDGIVAVVNSAVERMASTSLTGRTVEEVIASLGVSQPDGTPIAACDLPALRALARQMVTDCPLVITAADGTFYAIRASSFPLLQDGIVVGILSGWSDVTALSRVLCDEKRRRSEAEAFVKREEAIAETLVQQNEELLAQDEKFRQHLEEQVRNQKAFVESEQRVRRTLDRLLSPGRELPNFELAVTSSISGCCRN